MAPKYKDLPKSVADNDRDMEALLEQLEKGAVPAPEAPAPTAEAPLVPEPVVETKVDDPLIPNDRNLEIRLEKSEARYNTLKGMMTANATRSKEIIDGLTDQVAANKVAQVEAPLDIGSLLTEAEQAEFGESGVVVLEKIARAIASKEISKASLDVEQKLEAMRKRVDQAEASSEGNTTWDLVEKINPGSKLINKNDEGWFEFLDGVDAVSGRPYRNLAEAASQANDIQRLSELIDAYRLSANVAKPKVSVKPSQTPPAPNNDGNRQQESEKRKYSQEEVREFYDHRARGIRKGITAKMNAEQIEALEVDIDAAMEEGMVIL
jgi:hypothetical protein